ncbi:hypothetical protein [Allobaculum sp. Allo2]|nr:hypothetical protein [Allobaculum sp. Allo2]
MPFRDAYKLTGTLVADCIDKGLTLDQVSPDDLEKLCDLFDEDFYQAIDLDKAVADRKVYGGPCKENVLDQSAKAKEFVAAHKTSKVRTSK